MMTADLLRGFREGGWWVWLLVLWAVLSIVAALSDARFMTAFEWASSLATWLVVIYFYGIIHRLQDELKDRR